MTCLITTQKESTAYFGEVICNFYVLIHPKKVRDHSAHELSTLNYFIQGLTYLDSKIVYSIMLFN